MTMAGFRERKEDWVEKWPWQEEEEREEEEEEAMTGFRERKRVWVWVLERDNDHGSFLREKGGLSWETTMAGRKGRGRVRKKGKRGRRNIF